MLAYKYDKITKEFKYAQNAQKDPLNGGYLLPANSTFKEVPEYSIGYIPIFVDDNWVVEQDHRNHWQVKLDDITFSKVDYIGEVHIGCQVITDEEYEEYQADNDRFKVIDGVFTDIYGTPEYEEIKRQKEAERISHLKCTKRVLALILQEMGISYSQLKELIATSEQAQLEWDLCIELERCNPLIDIFGHSLGISSEQIDNIFKYANGEIPTLS